MKWRRIKNMSEWVDYKCEFLKLPDVPNIKFPMPTSYPVLVPATPQSFVGQVTTLPMVYGDDAQMLQGEVE